MTPGIPDLTDKLPVKGGGMDTRKTWMCGHKHHGGRWLGRVPMWCANCRKKPA